VLHDRLPAGIRRLAGVLQVGGADDAAEVAPAPVILGEEHEVPAGRRRLAAQRPVVALVRPVHTHGLLTGGAMSVRFMRALLRRPLGARRLSFRLCVQHALDVELDADDRLDAGLCARLIEAHGAVEAVVIGDGQRGHARRGRRLDQLVDAAGAVSEREVGVHMQVDEAHVHPLGPVT